jgi:hypothetical protein
MKDDGLKDKTHTNSKQNFGKRFNFSNTAGFARLLAGSDDF